MNILCPKCFTRYRTGIAASLDVSQKPVRCGRCGHRWKHKMDLTTNGITHKPDWESRGVNKEQLKINNISEVSEQPPQKKKLGLASSISQCVFCRKRSSRCKVHNVLSGSRH